MRRFQVAELIVEDNRKTMFLGQLGKLDQIVMTQAWALCRTTSGFVLQIAKAFVVFLVGFALMDG